MPNQPLRGRRGRDRRIAERVASDFAARHAPPAADAVDFDVAEVDAEVSAARAERAATARPRQVGASARPRVGGGHRLPDLSRLPPLLAATGTFASMRERLGRTARGGGSAAAAESRRVGRHVGLVSIPHGATSYLAAALAQGEAGERL